MKKYYPVIFVEIYLIVTLFIFGFGPVDFNNENSFVFWALMLLYHVSFVLGYFISCQERRDFEVVKALKIPLFLFYVAFFFGIISIANTYKNLMLSSSIIPYNIFNDIYVGLTEPGAVYTQRMIDLGNGVGAGGSRLGNIISFFFSFFKLLFIFIFIYYWSELGFFKKMLSILYSLFFLSSGFVSGTNSVVFIFFIFFMFSLLPTLYLKGYKHFKTLFLILTALALLPIGGFGYVMSQRGGGFDYFSTTSPLNDIAVTISTPLLDSFLGFYLYSLVWLNYYLVQGYYGFSLILNMDLNWTFGFGNSAFLQRQLLILTGVDVSDLTFQARVSQLWDKDAQWHSFYGQFANDFGFTGLAFLMFFLGYFFSKVWLSVIYKRSFYGAALLPIFILMFIFFPANNQVFGYIDTLSYFVFVSCFWLFEGKRVKF